MAENFQGFVTPEQQFPQLYNLSEKMERNRYLKQAEQQKQEARRTASDKYFVNYLDPNERFTGTNFDPVNAKLLGDALGQAFEMSKRGASDNEILMAISPLVNKVNQYTQKAKMLSAQKKQAVDVLSKQKGIDPVKFSNAFDEAVFMETDPETGQKRMKDLNMVDPSQNYADVVMREGDVFTPEGFDEYVAKAGKNTRVEDISVYNPNRSMRRTKAEITAPSFMISETDEKGAHIGFVPKYEIATDGEKAIMHKFLGDDGKSVDAPVRMVTSDVFQDLPATAKGYIRQEVRKFADENKIPISSAQAENLAKALAYDYLKSSGKQFSTFKEMQVQKAAPAPVYKSYTNINMPGGDQSLNNIYKRIDDKINAVFSRGNNAARFNSLANDEQQVVKAAVEGAGYEIEEGGSNVYLSKDNSGNIKVYKAEAGKLLPPTPENEIVTLSFQGTNIPKQPGVAEKRVVSKMGEQKTPPPQQKIDFRKKYNY